MGKDMEYFRELPRLGGLKKTSGNLPFSGLRLDP